ncbi:dihydrodipicolinate synthase family protein [uncultured Sphaerochaeta sp.]|uniref:dihydrodipicolinate synthase family protein n=1 Tax=uncultured Sphaerochaeta sp. TaxID=886478 RepID=UPI002A0A9EB3|nr:dihydrodipicolinate synthase family protein [uncultured Sphaerochaeta sp.]
MVEKPFKENGIYSALVTPFTKTRELDLPKLKELVRFERSRGVEGFYCCGSSGEGLLLEKTERMAIVETVAKEVGKDIPFIVHTGSLGTREAIALSLHAQECGAAAVSLIPPIYYHYSQKEVNQYYADVIDSIDLGVIVYNIPQFTGISFSKGNPLLENEKVVGIKHTSMNLYELERISQAFPAKTIFNGFDEIWLYSMAAGATATIGTTVNICPRIFGLIREAFEKNDILTAQILQHDLNDFIESLVTTGIFSSTKYCMTLQGIDVGPCRKPFDILDEEQKLQVKQALDKMQKYL